MLLILRAVTVWRNQRVPCVGFRAARAVTDVRGLTLTPHSQVDIASASPATQAPLLGRVCSHTCRDTLQTASDALPLFSPTLRGCLPGCGLVSLLAFSELCLTGMSIFEVTKSMNSPSMILYLYVSCVCNFSFKKTLTNVEYFLCKKISICFTYFGLILTGGSLCVVQSSLAHLAWHTSYSRPDLYHISPSPHWFICGPHLTQHSQGSVGWFISRTIPASPLWRVELFLYFDVTHFFNSCSLFRIILDVGGTNLFLNCCVSLFLDEFYAQLSSSVMGDPAPLWRSLAGSWCWAVPREVFVRGRGRH